MIAASVKAPESRRVVAEGRVRRPRRIVVMLPRKKKKTITPTIIPATTLVGSDEEAFLAIVELASVALEDTELVPQELAVDEDSDVREEEFVDVRLKSKSLNHTVRKLVEKLELSNNSK